MTHNALSCTFCGYVSDKRYNFHRHMKLVHGVVENGECEDVPQADDAIDIASASQPAPSYVCSCCDKVLSSQRWLDHHVAHTCKGLKNPLQCVKCHKVFQHRSSKSRHLRTCTGTCHIEEGSEGETSVEDRSGMEQSKEETVVMVDKAVQTDDCFVAGMFPSFTITAQYGCVKLT